MLPRVVVVYNISILTAPHSVDKKENLSCPTIACVALTDKCEIFFAGSPKKALSRSTFKLRRNPLSGALQVAASSLVSHFP